MLLLREVSIKSETTQAYFLLECEKPRRRLRVPAGQRRAHLVHPPPPPFAHRAAALRSAAAVAPGLLRPGARVIQPLPLHGAPPEGSGSWLGALRDSRGHAHGCTRLRATRIARPKQSCKPSATAAAPQRTLVLPLHVKLTPAVDSERLGSHPDVVRRDQ